MYVYIYIYIYVGIIYIYIYIGITICVYIIFDLPRGMTNNKLADLYAGIEIIKMVLVMTS